MLRQLKADGHNWEGIRSQCLHVVRNCVPCQEQNPARKGVHALTSILATEPFDHVAVDLFGPLPVSSNGYLYVLVLVDVATRFIILRPMRSKTAAETADTLALIIADFGVFKIMQSDNGKEFSNKLVAALKRACGFEHRFISAYHPRANGLSEAGVKVAKVLLFKLLGDNTAAWDRRLPAVQYGLNQRVMLRTGMRPFTLFFGRQSHGMENFRNAAVQEVDLPAIVERVEALQEEVWPQARQYAERQAMTERDNHDLRARTTEFQPGDIVMRTINGRTKSMPKYKGPYTVARRTAGGTYVLIHKEGNDTSRAPPNQLKLVERPHEVDVSPNDTIVGHRMVQGSLEFLVGEEGNRSWRRHEDVPQESIHAYYEGVEMDD